MLQITFLAILVLSVASVDVLDSEQRTSKQMNDPQQYLEYSCIMLSRYQLSFYGTKLVTMVSSQLTTEDKQNVWKKIYTGHVLQCLDRLAHSDSLELIKEISHSTFELKKYIHIFSGFDMDIFSTTKWPHEVVEAEEYMWNEINVIFNVFIDRSKGFEQLLREKKEEERKKEEEAEKSELEQLWDLKLPQINDYEPKMFGLSTRGGGIYDAVLLLCVFGGFGGVMVIGFLKLVREDQNEKSKRKQKKDQKTE